MRERTLLERLRAPRSDVPGEMDVHLLARSIRDHLQSMLNTRAGGSLTAPDYGMPDLTEAVRTCPDSIGSIEEAIRESIEKYEPRLGEVVVRSVPAEEGSLALSFEISARLKAPDADAGVLFETRVNSNGRVSVKV